MRYRREAILTAARDLVRQGGAAALTLTNILELADIRSKVLFYQLFANLEEVKAILRQEGLFYSTEDVVERLCGTLDCDSNQLVERVLDLKRRCDQSETR